MKQRILIVEDDEPVAWMLRENLDHEGFDVRMEHSGASAVATAKTFSPDLVVLDVMLPDVNGFDICGQLRHNSRAAVIMLTALSDKPATLRGLNAGADDYITKPFDRDEFLARVRAVLRRIRPAIGELTLGRTTLDFQHRKATREGKDLKISHREMAMLQYLAERRDQVVLRTELLREIWGYADTTVTRAVDQAIFRLRRKIEADHDSPQYIHTVHGDGYCLTPDG